MSAARGAPAFRVVLVEPEIPNNTGNIGRTCVATGCALHLVRPLGFDTSEKACRRAGLDYWPRLDLTVHESLAAFLSPPPARMWLFTAKSPRSFFDAEYRLGDALVFGGETKGLPASLLGAHPECTVAMPMVAGERSLNVATAACAAVYEGLRQLIARGDVRLDGNGRLLPAVGP